MDPLDSNVGQVGVDSIRLAGRRIENLPLAEQARAVDQIPAARKAELESKRAAIRARYPRQSVAYLEGRIREARANIKRISDFRDQQRRRGTEYAAEIGLCRQREKLEAAIPNDDPERERKLAELRKQFPPYNVAAMEQQIEQFDEAVRRCDGVIAQENASIAELSEVLALVRRRDEELRHATE